MCSGMEDIILNQKKVPSTRLTSSTNSVTAGINAKIFAADTGKYLNTQKLRYIEKEAIKFSDSNKKIKHTPSKPGNSSKQALDTTNQFAHLVGLPTVSDKTTTQY